MRLIQCLLVPLLIMPSWLLAMDVFRCLDEQGRVIFSDQPCGPDASRIHIEAAGQGSGARENLESIQRLAENYRAQRVEEARVRAEAALTQREKPITMIEQVPVIVPVYPAWPGYPRLDYRYPYTTSTRWSFDARGRIGNTDLRFEAGSPGWIGDRLYPPTYKQQGINTGLSGRFPGGFPDERRR